MTPMRRTLYEFANIAKVMPVSDTMIYVSKAFITLPSILRSQKLAALDWKMHGTYKIRFLGHSYVLPIGRIDELLAGSGDSPTFGTVRELFGANVYLRAFSDLPLGKPAIDLGANRGISSVLLATSLEAPLVVGVEPETIYQCVLDLLLRENDLEPNRFPRRDAFISSDTTGQSISMGAILGEFDISEVGFVKIDIEGGEFDLFSRNTDWLDVCDNVAMEVHREKGDPKSLVRILQSKDFNVLSTDQFGQPSSIDEERTNYLDASSTGALR